MKNGKSEFVKMYGLYLLAEGVSKIIAYAEMKKLRRMKLQNAKNYIAEVKAAREETRKIAEAEDKKAEAFACHVGGALV